MAINLMKGQKVDLTKGNASLKTIVAGLGWDTNKYDGGFDFDLDASAFLIGENGKVITQEDFIFYGNLIHKSGAVEHIKVNLQQIPSNIQKVVFTVTIYEAEKRKQNFGQISNAYIRIINDDDNKELIRYDLGEDFSIETAIVVGEIYRHNGEWKFNAVGSGFQGGLAALCANYGIEVA